MSINLCRFCLGYDNLKPLFEDYTHYINYSIVLKRTTGLDIKMNDGFPQIVCEECSITINSFLDFQNQCLKSEIELNKFGFEKNEHKHVEKEDYNKINEKTLECKIEEIHDTCEDFNDYYGLPDMQISVEFDRLSQNEVQDIGSNIETNEDIKSETVLKPTTNKDVKKLSRKEKRELYISLIDGKFDPDGPIRCKICKKTVSRWTSFITHSKLHLGFNFVCEFCGKSFISITRLNRHCRSHHGMKRELQCSQCDYLALDNTQLNLHMRSVHTGERPYVCDYCNASYSSRKCLLQHIEYHLSDKSVQCDKCPKKFKSRRHLSKHIYITHTSKEYKYQCPICDQMYRNFKYIGVHLKKIHGVSKKDVKIVKIKL